MNNSAFNLCTQDLGGACLLQTPSLPMPPALELESTHRLCDEVEGWKLGP